MRVSSCNFNNLTTARVQRRSREIHVCRVKCTVRCVYRLLTQLYGMITEVYFYCDVPNRAVGYFSRSIIMYV